MSFLAGSDHSFYDWTGEDSITQGLYYIPINFVDSRAQFVILKACDGTRDTPFYPEAMRDARAAGKLAAPYVWIHGRNWFDPRAQGEFWYSRLKDEPLIAVDFENYSDSIPNFDDLYNAVNRMFELGYKGRLMLYTSWSYWLSYGSPATVWLDLFKAGIWLSDPDDDPPNCPSWASASEKLRKAPTPFPDYAIHQNSYSGDPAEYGVTNGKLAVDENKFLGTMDELKTLFGAEVSPPQGEKMYTVTPIQGKAYVNVRADHSATSADIGDLKAGQFASGHEVWVNGTTDKWLHVTKVNGGALDGWVAVLSGGNAFTDLAEVSTVNIEVFANGAKLYGKEVPVGGTVRIDISD